jgi:dihydroorotate dehydrogenase (fumarate)
MIDLTTDYLGLELASPLVASSSPLTNTLDGLRALEDAGAAAVVLPSLFEEELEHVSRQIDGMLETGAESHGEATGYFPELADYDSGPDRHLALLASAKEALAIPVIGSLNGTTPGGWLEYSKSMEQAGADALELNLYEVVADPDATAEKIEAGYVELVRTVRNQVGIPVSLKIGPYFTALSHTARALEQAGAAGLVLFNRFYQPDLDLETLDVAPRLKLSTSEELRLPLRWIAILHGQLDCSLAATTGIHRAEDALKVLLAGADVAMMASALLARGPRALSAVQRGIFEWMEEREYDSIRQLKGSLSRGAVADPGAYERANYLKTLRSFSSPAQI